MAVKPFPLDAFSQDELGRHDLGEILTPEQMAAKVPPGASPGEIAAATRKALDALAGCGPGQMIPHLETRLALCAGLARLRDFALAGDRDAAAALGAVLSEAVADLAELARRNPEVVRAWSSEQSVVPVLTGQNIGHRKQLAADLAAFAVGEVSPYRVNPPPRKRGPDASSRANALAGALCSHLADHRAKARILKKPVPQWVRLTANLPELAKETWEAWAEAAWECLLDATDGHPEENEFLNVLGRKAENRDGLKTLRTLAANVRAEIRQTLREAIRTLAG